MKGVFVTTRHETSDHRTEYLFLIARASAEARLEAVKYLREIGVKVLSTTGDAALVGVATPRHVEVAAETGIFSLITRQSLGRETLTRLEKESPAHLDAVRQWNYRRSPTYLKRKKRQADRGTSWGADDRAPHQPTPPIEPEAVIDKLRERFGTDDPKQILEQIGDKRRTRLKELPPIRDRNSETLAYLRERFADRLKDENLIHKTALTCFFLEPLWIQVFLVLDITIILWVLEVECWKMEGEIAVGVVFVESSRSGGPRFSASEKNTLEAEITAGLNWLAAEAPNAANLTWAYDWQNTTIDVADQADPDDDTYWRWPGLEEVDFNGTTYSGDLTGLADYREDLRRHFFSAHALVIFVTPFNSTWFASAWSSSKFIRLAEESNWGGWGITAMDTLTVHETCHLFGAADEYTGSGTPCSSCGTLHGCYQLPNGNCKACADPGMDCVMDANDLRLCPYTQGHIGWADLFVELETDDVLWAGTDDWVHLDIGDRAFNLDNPSHDDRERGDTQGYALNYTGVSTEDIKRIGIRKGEDGHAGGWKFRQIKVWHRGDLVCSRTPNTWLEDDHLWWACPSAGSSSTIVNTLKVKVTTADVWWAGTDDDVTLYAGGRSWNLDNDGHNDFERGNTDTFDLDPGTGLYESALSSLRVHKSPDGVAGGWKLKGLEIIANGSTIYNNQSVNKWLEDGDRDWYGSI